MWRNLPKLKFLKLELWDWKASLGQFCVDLSFCSCLESLKITLEKAGEREIHCSKLSELQLSSLPKLKRVELMGWFPETHNSLPPDCELLVSVAFDDTFPQREQWEAMQRHLTIASLATATAELEYMADIWLREWPVGFERLTRLQFLRFQCSESLEQDLAVLKAIPHVDLTVDGMASLNLTSGTWQSLKVHGRHGLCITFSDADAFVRGTGQFLFDSSGNREISQPMCASIGEACSRQSKSYYLCEANQQYASVLDHPYTVRVSNCKDMMRSRPLLPHEELQAVWATFMGTPLDDGHASSSDSTTLWESLPHKLVSQEDFWPAWEPHKWCFGKHATRDRRCP